MMFRFSVFVIAAAISGCASLPPRQFADIGEANISWVRADGDKPTVVFQSGLGDGMKPWASVIERVSVSSAVFAYDRPGYGASTPAPQTPRSPCDVARELRATLHAAGLSPPFLLVGHSLGGQYQYAFATLYPGEVAGMVLLDPTHPEHWTSMQQQAPGASAVITGLRATVFSAAMRSEFDGQGVCLQQAPFNSNIPARILVRTRFDLSETPAFRAMTEALEKRWLSLIPKAKLIQVKGAGHYIQRDKPDVVAAEILSLVHEVSQGNQ